ncbi:MAG: hypothetical protein KAW16_01200 [candidate division Zixibacteria bacterium]|nr:hypothetical protein [candidate division Zixibacteria bacterium]
MFIRNNVRKFKKLLPPQFKRYLKILFIGEFRQKLVLIADSKNLYVRYANAYFDLLSKLPATATEDIPLGRFELSKIKMKKYLTIEEYDYSPIKYIVPDYSLILQVGTNGIRKSISKWEKFGGDNDSYKDNLMRIIVQIETYFTKLREDYRKLKTQSKIIQLFKKAVEVLPEGGAYDLCSAIQLLWIFHNLVLLSGHRLMGIGRLDQLLYPYFKHDLEMGNLNTDEVKHILRQFILSLHSNYEERSAVFKGDTGLGITLGGVDCNGTLQENDLTMLILEIFKDLHPPEPKLHCRCSTTSSDDYLTESAKVIKESVGYPIILNDEIIIPSLQRYFNKIGLSRKLAYEYTVDACWIPLSPGVLVQPACKHVNLYNVLIDTFNTFYRQKKEISFDILLKNYENKIDREVQEIKNLAQEVNFLPSAILTILSRYSLSRGKDIKDTPKCFVIWGEFMAEAVNSLYAIKLLLEGDLMKETDIYGTYKNLLNANKYYLEYLKNKIDKFGNDIDEIDSLYKSILNSFVDAVEGIDKNNKQKLRNNDSVFVPALLTGPDFIWQAEEIGAFFNGRGKGDFLSSNLSPTPGTAKKGTSATINSALRADLLKLPGGATLDVTLNSKIFDGSTGDNNLVAIIKTFLEKGGFILAFNYLNKEQLISAQRNPQLYKDLIVRVWGMCAHFVDLPKEVQDHIIERC